MKNINVSQMPGFKRSYKRLHPNQKIAVNQAIDALVDDPTVGEGKKGDLAGVSIYKFDCINQHFLLAYTFDTRSRTLIALGVHESFYRDLKKY